MVALSLYVYLCVTKLEGSINEERRLEEGYRGGHCPKTGRSAKEGGGKEKEMC